MKTKTKLYIVVPAKPRKDGVNGLEFYCEDCRTTHRHGGEEGFRQSHCSNEKSILFGKEYYLKLDNENETI